jgi:flagellar biosynthesis/type III secretory pathway M-ring protein FliF/YscJ
LPAIKYASFLLLFLLVYLILFRPIKKRVVQSLAGVAPVPAQIPALEAGAEPPKALPGAGPVKEVTGTAGEPAALPGTAEEAAAGEPAVNLEALDDQIEREFMKEAQLLDAGTRKYAVMKKKLTERAKREPEMVSQLIRTWIHEKD